MFDKDFHEYKPVYSYKERDTFIEDHLDLEMYRESSLYIHQFTFILELEDEFDIDDMQEKALGGDLEEVD